MHRRRGRCGLLATARDSRWMIVGLAILITCSPGGLPANALAAHNSVGAHASLVQADEVSEDGALLPDVARDPSSPHRFRWHANLEALLGTARLDPPDQTGNRYNPRTDGCEAYIRGMDPEAYALALTEGRACAVGYLDAQWEYRLVTHLYLVRQPDDPLYPVNPRPGDGHCRGEAPGGISTPLGPAPPTGIESVDEGIARLQRGPVDGGLLGQGRCTGEGHPQYIPGQVLVDTDLLEPLGSQPGLHGDGATSLSDPASGYQTLPLIVTPYVFLLGQPHPGTPDAERSHLSAARLNDLTAGLIFPTDDPCGDRTRVCELLTPGDIRRYDDQALGPEDGASPADGDGSEDDAGAAGQARVCVFRPQFVTVNPDQRAAGACGPLGDVVDQYLEPDQAGGLGLDALTGGAPTWLNTMPGWYEGTLLVTLGSARPARDTADAYAGVPVCLSTCVLTEATDPVAAPGVIQVVAVNPAVPDPGHPLWCVRPNLLATGDDTLLPEGLSDPGVFGAYRAQAIDVDVYATATREQHAALLGASHGLVRDGIQPGPALPEEAEGVPVDGDGDDRLGLRDVETLYLHARDAVAGDAGSGPPAVRDALERVDPTEDPEPDPDHVTPRTPSSHPERFDRVLPAGLGCDAGGEVGFEPYERVHPGGLRFELRVEQGQAIKDPTAFDDEGLPQHENETRPSGWRPGTYTLSGTITARTDANENGRFDPCVRATGQPQPARDPCGWRALWDAYDPGCTDIQATPCSELLEALGYDLDAGVGLYLVVRVDGPVLVERSGASSQGALEGQRARLLGGEDVQATNCIVGTSRGLLAKLVAPANLDVRSPAGLLDELCEGADGERWLVEDAFETQDGIGRGTFSSSLRFTKPTASPDGTDEASPYDGLEACVFGIWNVEDGLVAQDTLDTLELSGHTRFGDCDVLRDA